MKPRYYQTEAIDSIWHYFANGGQGNPLVAMPTGCHAKGHPILLADGTIQKVENIKVGDLLLGPDSKPRRVLRLARGRQEMRRIIPTKGEPFVVNLDHKLSVKRVAYRGKKALFKTITVREYEQASRWFRHIHKLRRTGVDFDRKHLPLDPYFLGLMLGDGSLKYGTPSFCGKEPALLDSITRIGQEFGCKARLTDKEGTEAKSLHLPHPDSTRSNENPLTREFRLLGLGKFCSRTAFIPDLYLKGDRKQRLSLLAGLIDSDGHYTCNSYDYCTISKELAHGVLFLARSLGLAAYLKEGRAKLYGVDKGAKYRISISGDIDEIPVLIGYKKGNPRKQRKDVLCTGFTLEKLPVDDYFGFTLSGDHLYLDGYFNVHHNTGKSIVIGGFIKKVYFQYPTQRIMMLTHVKELIEQNYDKLLRLWPTAPAGIYSAGVGRKDTHAKITFAGIQSVVKLPHLFGHIDLIIVDEAHLVSPKEDTSYHSFIKALKEVNPYIKVVGLTATPYRLGLGMLTGGGLFTDICYDLTTLSAFNRLIGEGFIAPLVPRHTGEQLDLSGVGMSGGEFKNKDLQEAVDKEAITYKALTESLELGHDRKHWLVFATGIAHAENIASMLDSMGVSAAVIHGNLNKTKREEILADFKKGKYQALVNNNVLTTGFDFPAIDMIIMLRPTNSPGLWVQMLGRGTRPVYADGFDLEVESERLAAIAAGPKQNCLVLDFAGNTTRLGPINDPVIPTPKGKKQGGAAPVRLCEQCQTYNHASVRVCEQCGFEFPVNVKFGFRASAAALISDGGIQMEVFEVNRVTYSPHSKRDRPDAIKVDYYCGIRKFSTYVCIEHGGFAAKKALEWWREHWPDNEQLVEPSSTAIALEMVDQLKEPTHIRVWLNKKYPEIKAYNFTGGF